MPSKSDSFKIPKNWPTNIPYLTTPAYSQTLNPTHLQILRTRSTDSLPLPPNNPKGPSPLVKITPISLPSHPAYGQSGLFAVKDLKPGSFILQYVGEIHASPNSNPDPESGTESNSKIIDPHANSNYDLSLDRNHGLGIDADQKGNEARFINDYRGVAERPNAEFREVWDEGRKERGMGVWVLGGKGRERGIRRGEEVVVSYGRGFWGARKSDQSSNDDG